MVSQNLLQLPQEPPYDIGKQMNPQLAYIVGLSESIPPLRFKSIFETVVFLSCKCANFFFFIGLNFKDLFKIINRWGATHPY